ncbi:MAG: hypothetical protein EXS14_01740 [Planctomycetes bacterium]|nr:hypothetical protein [Planctomycetota bacterium]
MRSSLAAAAHWHELLAAESNTESAKQFRAAQDRERLLFGERPICKVLRPLFLSPQDAEMLTANVRVLMSAYRKLRHVLTADSRLRAWLQLSGAEEAILAADLQPFEPDVVGRMDGFLADGVFRVVEYNAESPGGIGFGDRLATLFENLPVMRRFHEQWKSTAFHGLERTLEALKAADRSRLGERAKPNPAIAIVDRLDVPTVREFELCAESFRAAGCTAQVIDVHALRFENGVLHADGFKPDIVYKRALVKDLLKLGGAQHPLARAVAARAVTCASGFGVHLLFRKELFAMLHDSAFHATLDAKERAAVQTHVPWSSFVNEEGHAADGSALLPWIRSNKAQLVLKPTDDYGGAGVVLGWTVDDAAWSAALQGALEAPHIVQQRVTLPRESFPLLEEPQRLAQFYTDVDPYVWNGTNVEGFGARLAPGELLNVTAGGGSAVPVFIVEKR